MIGSALVALLALSQGQLSSASQGFTFGFGVDRLKARESASTHVYHAVHDLNDPTSLEAADPCAGVEAMLYHEAVLDNFASPANIVHWANPQRYWINKEFWTGPGAPIFVYIGGEGAESCKRLKGNSIYRKLAEEQGALLIDIEHRFYGLSYPTTDMSTKNLQYLSADQALADLARLVEQIKLDLKTVESKVISFGGSYPGSLSAWFRLKYPNVVQGAIASSAPIIASVNMPGYMDVVAQALVYFSGQSCYDAFEEAANKVAFLSKTSEGLKQLEKDFKVCAPLDTDEDLSILLSDLMGNIQGTVQYNMESATSMNVTDICSTMLQTEDAYQQFVTLSNIYLASSGKKCEDASWEHSIEHLSDTKLDSTNNMRPWTYQTCSEFGYYQTTDSTAQPFHSWKLLNLDFYRAICAASFDGWDKDPDVNWVNTKYGGIHIDGTHIEFTGGTIDPWHALGVTNATTLEAHSEHPVYMLGTAHCRDLTGPLPGDSASIIWAHEKVTNSVRKWLARKSQHIRKEGEGSVFTHLVQVGTVLFRKYLN